MKGALKTLAMVLVVGALLVPTRGSVAQSQRATLPGTTITEAMPGADQPMGSGLVFLRSLAKDMGISTDQLIDQLKAGKSLRDIGAAQGMDDKALGAAIRMSAQDAVSDMVARTRITTEQANTIMQVINDIGDTHLVNLFDMMLGHFRAHHEGMHRERGTR